jgi:hypothetical protein
VDEICVLRPPSPFILSPEERKSLSVDSGFANERPQIQLRVFSKERQTILLLLGEKAGMREDVKQK